MIFNTKRTHLMATTILLGAGAMALAVASQAMAQTTPAANQVNEVVVTGSRISGLTNANSASPISVSTIEQIEQTKSNSLEDVLTRMIGPDFNSTSINSNNGGDGYSSVSLRNLGPARTLVLIDGTRIIPNGGSVDLNTIPLAMVERVEILRDGASSIYGADAIAGVVNIITKKHASGMTVDASYGESGKGDGATYSLNSTVGLNSDKGNVLIGVSWDHRDAIAGSNRSWATDAHANDPNYPGGSSYRSQLDVLQDEYSSNVFINGVTYNKHNPAIVGLAPNLAYLTTTGVVKMDANGPDWNTLTGSLDRKEISFNTHYDITDTLQFISEGFYTDRTSEQLLRPEPLLGDTIATFAQNGSTIWPGLIIPATAPGNTTGKAITAYLTPTQFGPRTYDQDSQTYRLHVGLAGKVFGNIKWEGGYVYQSNTEVLAIGNSGNWYHIGQLLGQFPCVDVPGGCTNGLPNVQPNWFNGPNNIFTPAQLAYAKYTRHDNQHSSENYGYFNFNGSLFKLPAGEVKFAAGAENRAEHLDYTPDELTQEGYTANASLPTSGTYNVTTGYGEIFIPLLKNLPFVKSLELTPSYRYDSYSNFGGAGTYKVGLNYAVSDDLRFRSSVSTGFRAPQIGELFGGQSVSDNGASGDPCETNLALKAGGNTNVGKGVLTAGSTCSKAVAAGAAVTSFTDPLDQIGGSQLQVLQGGSTTLKPEKSRDFSAGLVFTPTMVPGFSFEGDYYKIRISNAILIGGIAGAQNPDFILNGCYGPQQNQSFCSDVVRNSAGVITQINSLNTNAGSQMVDGVEMEASYDTGRAHLTLPVPGAVRLDTQISRQLHDRQVNVDGSLTYYTGYFNSGAEDIYPAWRIIMNVDYRLADWNFHWDTRYTSAMNNFDGSAPVYGNHVPDMYYSAASVTYYINHFGPMNHSKIIVGIDNIFDQDPPFIGSDSTCKCNTIAGPFDLVGRFFYTRLSAAF